MICHYVKDTDHFIEDPFNWNQIKYLNDDKLVINNANRPVYHQSASVTNHPLELV